MTSRTNLAALALAATMIATASGCGGSGSSGLSSSQLIAKADPICHRVNTTVESAKLAPENIVQVGPRIVAAERQAQSELAKLTPASSMTADWKAILGAYEKAGNGMQKAVEAAKSSGSNKALQSKAYAEGATEFSTAQRSRQIVAGRDGFVECSKF